MIRLIVSIIITLTALFLIALVAAGAALVPWFDGGGYERDEPTNDPNMFAVWQMQSNGVPVAVVDDWFKLDDGDFKELVRLCVKLAERVEHD